MHKNDRKSIRVLGVFDLAMLLVVAIVNLNLVPAVAANGLNALPMWVCAFFLFFLPQAIAVLELSSLYPGEGGVYLWSKIAFGDFHGFMSGWCYWLNNIAYIPTLLFYLTGFSLYIYSKEASHWADNTFVMACASLFLLWLIIGLNIIGMGVGKWVQNAGALGTFVTVAIILVIAFIALFSNGSANAFEHFGFLSEDSGWRTASMLGLVCFAFVGLELGSVMGDEIKNPERNIPRAVVIAGICSILLYMICTFALQALIPVADIEAISGLLQVTERIAAIVHMPEVIPPLALMLSLSVLGAACAWLAGSARIPFVIGIDRYLPSAFGRTHRRYQTPHVALITQGIASTVIILFNSIGSGAQDVYLILLNTAVIIQLIPFLYIFATLIKVRRTANETSRSDRFFKRSWVCYLAGASGFTVTVMGLLLAFVPSDGVENVVSYEIKLLSGCVFFIAPALVLFQRQSQKIRESDIASAPLTSTIQKQESIGI